MGLLFFVFILSMAVATFIENSHDSITARNLVYNAKWFELIFILLGVNLVGQIFTRKLFAWRKITILLFHLAFLLIIIGAGITRYFSFEANIHIREGQTQGICYTSDKFIKYTISKRNGDILYSEKIKTDILKGSLHNYQRNVVVDDIPYQFALNGVIPNAYKTIEAVKGGKPIISLIISTKGMGRQSFFIEEGEVLKLGEKTIGFTKSDTLDITFVFDKDNLMVKSTGLITEVGMGNSKSVTHPRETYVPVQSMQLYNIDSLSFVLHEFSISAEYKPVQAYSTNQNPVLSALEFEVKSAQWGKTLYIWKRNESLNDRTGFDYQNHVITIEYGNDEQELPFTLTLNDFVLERYHGSNSPSSYKSHVMLINKDEGNSFEYEIYMNHLLKYKGYRIYQSSYDTDERGTILLITRDRFGIAVTYTGYFLLFLFMVLSLFNRNSLFRTFSASNWTGKGSKVTLLLIFFLILPSILTASPEGFVVNKKISDKFGEVLVQDQNGRIEPMFTLSNDILRKISRKSSYKGLSSMQVFLGFYLDFDNWQKTPIIKVANKELQKVIGIKDEYASFRDIVELRADGGIYKIGQYLEAAYSKPFNSRSKFDKEVIKLDEKVNICYMIYTGDFFRCFPVKDRLSEWYSPQQASRFVKVKEDSLYITNILIMIANEIKTGYTRENNNDAIDMISSITYYQHRYAGFDLPGKTRISTEILFYKANIFERLFPFYAILSTFLFIVTILGIISTSGKYVKTIRLVKIFLFTGFILHTICIAARWYISGHPPLSNGYESMIFISWATLLAGFSFSRKSPFTISATALLASLTLLVAHLSFMDPEITNLVPVLKSYWLTLHVSVITSSYGFLGLGAILGLIAIVLYTIVKEKNYSRIYSTIEELSIINYKTLTIGLYLLTIGTFLGAIWANESWGRYWGWDPKETWSLITIIVYSFVLHSKMIRGFNNIFMFNFLSLSAFSSVLMTYFGVNYFLSGLHSYAAGEFYSVPRYIFWILALMLVLVYLAYRKYRRIPFSHSDLSE